MKYVIPILLMVMSLFTPVACTVKGIHFNQECEGYLKQAADANTAEIALDRIDLALEYIERNNLTDGYTSVLWRTEDENIGFWYQNIKACKSELESCIGGSQLEKSNVLMKVRESLTDNGDSGTELTIPSGLCRYPNNAVYMLFGWLSLFAFIIGLCWFLYLIENDY